MTFSTLLSVKYYGATYGKVSVNSNGFLTLGWSDCLCGDNSPIPDEQAQVRMIAPFWTHLDPSSGGDIYRWLDTVNHRWIIQFDGVRHWGSTDTETFQVIILNQSAPLSDADRRHTDPDPAAGRHRSDDVHRRHRERLPG